MPITNIKIFPSIGIARLGNSPNDFFIGPEVPGDRTLPPGDYQDQAPPAGGYKDPSCRIKRQAARFRLFGYDGATFVQEITKDDATIEWTVELANTKGSWRQFNGLQADLPGRNGLIGAAIGNSPPHEVKPGPRTLTGPNQAAGFNTGKFLGKVVPLGEMRTDSNGRLLVLGGFGRSEGEIQLQNIFNNNQWHDDVSDGPVTAKVTLNGAMSETTVEPAWVICGPPDFAPPIAPLTSLYDVLFQVARENTWVDIPAQPSFTYDISPILQRGLDYRWVNEFFASTYDLHKDKFASSRIGTFARVRDPNNANVGDMPQIFGDNYNNSPPTSILTKAQYEILQKWAGTPGVTWIDDSAAPPPKPVAGPEDMTRAALDACAGGAYWPGIEAGWYIRDTTLYKSAFRFDHIKLKAGDVTRQMALPWQTDFFMCKQEGDHLWWPSQRPDDVIPESTASGASTGATSPWVGSAMNPPIVTGQKDMVEQWHKLGFVVKKVLDGNEVFVETERHATCINIFLIIDRSSFSDDEVNAALSVASPARFEEALYVVAEGFKPADLGLTPGVSTATYTAAALLAIAPAIALKHSGGAIAGGMSAVPQKVLAQVDPPPANQLQRFTFVYNVEFTNVSDFASDLEEITATATKTVAAKAFNSAGKVTLFKKANPYMVHGPTSWLATDVRVFKVTEGEPLFGLPNMGNNAAAALSFIDSVVAQFRVPGSTGFNTLSGDQQVSRLELAEKVSGKRVFNFAVARVRYRGNLGAAGVRVFFRLFTVAATGVSYDETSTYRRTPGFTPISLLGLQANKVVTIPCYGRARVDTSTASLITQGDDLNIQDLEPLGNDEFQGYFGCWLDFNQLDKRFPVDVGGSKDGPWPLGDLKSVQELIRGMHQCLVAEVYFKDDLIPFGVSPSTSDNLAQRNLAIVESANPGVAGTRTVQHTLEIKATTPAPEVVFDGSATGHEQSVRFIPAGPDELMIRWGNLPRSTRLTVYMPDVEADEILAHAGRSYEAQRLERVDAHTILCLPGDITYIPLPTGRKRNIAALATLELPAGVERGQRFSLFFHQISGRPRAVLGSVQMDIPVSTKADLLEPEIRKLSVLRHIARAIPPEDQWHPVFLRYLGQIEDRVAGFGGDPDQVAPSPDGSGRDEVAERCARRGWLVSFLLALLTIIAGLHPAPPYVAEIILALGFVVAVLWWKKTCLPSLCRIVHALIVGLGLGAAVLAALVLAGLTGPLGVSVLLTVALLLGILLVVGVRLRCFRFAGG